MSTESSAPEPPQRPLRIAMLTNLYPPVVSGSSGQVEGLSQALVRAGHEVVVVTSRVVDDSASSERAHGVDVVRLPCLHLPRFDLTLNFAWLNALASPANLRRIRRLLQERQIDVIHVHNHMFDTAFIGAWLGWRLGIPVVVTIHSPLFHLQRLYNGLLRLGDRLLLRPTVMRTAASAIAPDQHVAAYAAERFPHTPTAMVPYGIDTPRTPEPAEVEALRTRLGLEGKRVILSLGHVNASRHRLDLIEAFPAVREAFPEAVLLVVGDRGYAPSEERAAALGLEGSVRFVGAMPHEEIPVLMGLAEFETHWGNQCEAEAMSPGIASMEAMAAGLTIVAAVGPDAFGPGVLRPGHNLVLARPGDHEGIARTLIELLDDPERNRSIGGAARDLAAKRFSWPAIADANAGVYRDAIGPRP